MPHFWRNPMVVAAVLLIVGATTLAYNIAAGSSARLNEGHYAVLLTNGQVYFGRVDNSDRSWTILRDIFYLTTTGEGEQMRNMLVRRGNEWHQPSEMLINRRHILLIEPVGSASKVAQLIDEASADR